MKRSTKSAKREQEYRAKVMFAKMAATALRDANRHFCAAASKNGSRAEAHQKRWENRSQDFGTLLSVSDRPAELLCMIALELEGKLRPSLNREGWYGDQIIRDAWNRAQGNRLLSAPDFWRIVDEVMPRLERKGITTGKYWQRWLKRALKRLDLPYKTGNPGRPRKK